MAKKYNICLIGAGHVGLVAAACFAELGHRVYCVDNDKKRIKSLKAKAIPFYEPDLEPLVKKGTRKKNLAFSTSLIEGIKKSQVIFIAVGTPPQPDGSADLSAIENVAQVIAKNLNSYKLIVGKSTVPVQTGKKIKETILRYKKKARDFDVASNPEFLREGKAIHDFFCPDRIVIGIESKRAENVLKDIYSKIDAPMVVTDINTAELIKHACNSFLATKISFINAVGNICEIVGADIKMVARGMGLDKRIGNSFLNAGLGFGGFCFPKDLAAFRRISEKLGYDFNLLLEVEKINNQQKKLLLSKIKENVWNLENKTIGILGLSYKPDTDDIRFAPALDIIRALMKEKVKIKAFDPKAMKNTKEKIKNIKYCKDPYSVTKDSDCLVIVTEWSEFKKLDFKKIKKLMKQPLVIDARNIYEPAKLKQIGFKYIGMGQR